MLRGTSCLSTKTVPAELWSEAFLVQSSAYTHVALCLHSAKHKAFSALLSLVHLAWGARGAFLLLEVSPKCSTGKEFSVCCMEKQKSDYLHQKKKPKLFSWGAADKFLQMCQKCAVTKQCVHSQQIPCTCCRETQSLSTSLPMIITFVHTHTSHSKLSSKLPV